MLQLGLIRQQQSEGSDDNVLMMVARMVMTMTVTMVIVDD